MKTKSIKFKFLITIISAMLAVTVFIGGLSIYEVDNFVQHQTEDYINAVCEKEVHQINDIFDDMQKSVHVMESYVLGLIKSKADIESVEKRAEIVKQADEMFADVAKHAEGAVAYYFRFDPQISDNVSGLFYSKVKGRDGFIRFEPTDLSLYDKDDTEHVGWYWQPYEAGEPVWMLPYYNKNNDILMISYTVPMYYEDQFIGIIGMDFDYTVLTDKINEMGIYEHGFARLEFEGVVVHNKTYDEGGAPYGNSGEYLQVSKELINGMTLVLSASYDDIRHIRYDVAFKILFVVLFIAALFSVVVVFVVRKIVSPLKNLTDASVKLSNGDYDVEIAHSNTYEIELLSTAFENMTMNLKEHERQQRILAYRDSLTGLRNTNSYKEWISDFDKEIENKNVDFGVIMLDINYLKETNDRYGHDAGNKLIVAAARIISNIFKRSPVFRIGGDEFLVILQNRDLEDYKFLLEKFDEECKNNPVVLDGERLFVSLAKGFALYDADNDTKFVDVFNRADDVMYEDKRATKSVR